MTEFLLLGTRPPPAAEVSPDKVGRDVVLARTWCHALRGWGLLRAFAVSPTAGSEPTACLIVRASGPAAASRLAVGWECATGYLVTVLPLTDAGNTTSGEDRPHWRAAA